MSYIKYCLYCWLTLRADNHGDLCFACEPSPGERERKRAAVVLEEADARKAFAEAEEARTAAWQRWDKAREELRKYER